jgi:hypothetical protein
MHVLMLNCTGLRFSLIFILMNGEDECNLDLGSQYSMPNSSVVTSFKVDVISATIRTSNHIPEMCSLLYLYK